MGNTINVGPVVGVAVRVGGTVAVGSGDVGVGAVGETPVGAKVGVAVLMNSGK